MSPTQASTVLSRLAALYPALAWSQEETELFGTRLRRIDIEVEQAAAAIAEYKATESKYTKSPNLAGLLHRLRAVAAPLRRAGSDPREWPLWRRYQAWMGEVAGGSSPAEVVLEWWNRREQGSREVYGAEDADGTACNGFLFDVLAEGMCGTVEEAAGLYERLTGRTAKPEWVAWTRRRWPGAAGTGAKG